MKKNYILITFLTFLCFVTHQGFSQSSYNNVHVNPKIEDLTVYPNPASNNTVFIYITSKNNLNKNVEIYNVLGKKVFSNLLTSKALNISKLSTGVYLLKIKENDIIETRKLIIK